MPGQISDSSPEDPKTDVADELMDEKPINIQVNTSANPPQRSLVGYASMYGGPLPPAEEIARYEKVLPDAANRLFAMVEREQSHRHKMDEKLAEAQIEDMKKMRLERARGQRYGLGIGVVAIISGSLIASFGAEWPGGVIGFGGVATLASVFVSGRRRLDGPDYPEIEE